MSEHGSIMDFGELEDDGLDIGAIFGGGNNAGEGDDIFAAPRAAAQTPTEETPETPQTKQDEVALTEAPEPGLFAAFAQNAETPTPVKQADTPQQMSLSLFDRPPVFSYGGAKEKIEDTSMTFEELRIAKAEDFPELAEGKKVSWTMEYGKTS